MKKRGRMWAGMLGASIMMMGVYAATQLTQLTTEQTNFSSYTAPATNAKLTQTMWNGMVNKVDGLAKNHEARLRALENALSVAPRPNLDCSPKTFKFSSIKFTTFKITEDLRNGQSRELSPVNASIAEIQASKYPNGTAPTWKITVRCENGQLQLVESMHSCKDGGEYSAYLGTCGTRRCYQEALGWKSSRENGRIDHFVPGGDNFNDGGISLTALPGGGRDDGKTLYCPRVEYQHNLRHGTKLVKPGIGYRSPNSLDECYEAYRCDNGSYIKSWEEVDSFLWIN